jgi:integrase
VVRLPLEPDGPDEVDGEVGYSVARRPHAKLPGPRFHDLRHTAITELAEMGTPDGMRKSIAGHITQRMLVS